LPTWIQIYHTNNLGGLGSEKSGTAHAHRGLTVTFGMRWRSGSKSS